jgi:peptide/nickel transport system substrate-binding protein
MVDMAVGVFGAQLTQIDRKNAYQPHLAESIEHADNASKWIFKLHKGLTFHNGKSVTPNDVIETYNYHRGEQSKSPIRSALSVVSDIKADGADTIVFTLKTPSADFPYVTSSYNLPIYPAKDGGGVEWEKGTSAGPFIIERFEPGIRCAAKRNPNYHISDRPHFDEVELLAIVDPTARNTALTTKEVHHINRLELRTVEFLRQNPDLHVDNITGFLHNVAPMIVTQPPFDDVNVRTALKWSIDRKEIVEKILFGYGTPGNDNPIAPSIKYASNPDPIHTYDPEKAKFFLRKAGLEKLAVDLSASEAVFPGAVDTALLMQAQAKHAGIDINVIREPDDGYWTNVWKKKPWCISYWGGRPTCDWMFTYGYAADAASNDTF